MGRARNGDILMKTGSTKTGEQGGKDSREIIGRVNEEWLEHLKASPISSEPGRPPVGAVEVKIPGGYRRLA